MYAHIYGRYEITDINHSTRSTVGTFHITNKYGCHIPDIAHKANMLYGHNDTTFLNIYTKTQPIAHLLHMLLPNMCQIQICCPDWAY